MHYAQVVHLLDGGQHLPHEWLRLWLGELGLLNGREVALEPRYCRRAN